MPPLEQQQQRCCEEQIVGDGNFKWGNKTGIGVRNKDTQFYDSFVLDGVEYFLYDCVCFYHTDHVETSIGKVVKMYQTSTQKRIKVVWFFRPSEIRNFFGSYKPGWNELFLASGKGTGVTNHNLLESIIGKCSVVCTSEDKRNPKSSETELKRADFYFKCTFDVDRLVIDEKFPDKIDGIEVAKFFNRKVDKKTSNNLHLEANNTSKSLKIKIKKRASEDVKDEVKAETAPSDILGCKVKDEVRISESVSPKIKMRNSENFEDEVKDEVKTKTATAPSDISCYNVTDKDEVRISENVSPKIKIRTSENFKDEVKTKTAPSDILHYKVIDKDEVRIPENVSPKIKIRTSENFKDEVKDEVKTKTAPSDILHCKVKDKVRTYENVSPKRLSDSYSFKKRKIIEENSTVGQSNNSQKTKEFDEKEALRQDISVKPNRKVTEVTERPNSEKRKWFKNMPWKERLQKAQESETLVLLSNLDPSYTSYEVEDLVWHALKEKVEARMIESSPTSNTYYGRALVIFRTKDAAENAMSELNRRCLILEGGRVVIARKGTVTDSAKKNTLTGHLSINRAALHKQSREMRNAVSTSHCSQPNTIEYAMAIEWTKLYYKSEACWKALCEKQMKEIDDVKSKLGSDIF